MKDTARDIPNGLGVSAPHVECYETAVMLHHHLRARNAAILDEHPDESSVEFLVASMELRKLSRAVQVFAGLTVEACVNLYGMLALGEDKFYGDKLEMKAFPKKLELIMALGRETPIAPDAELVALGASLAGMRNRIAHPKPRESSSKHSDEDASNTATDLSAADKALEDTRRFVHLLRTRDRAYFGYFMFF
jgi:hypothetical protein